MSTKSEVHRQRGNGHYKKFVSMEGGKARSRHHLMSARACYQEAWSVASDAGDDVGRRLAAKNLGVVAGYLGREEEGFENKLARFIDAAGHFNTAFRISNNQARREMSGSTPSSAHVQMLMMDSDRMGSLMELGVWNYRLVNQLETAMRLFYDFITGKDIPREMVNKSYEDIIGCLHDAIEYYPVRIAVAKARLNQFEYLSNLAAKLISEKQYKLALDLIAECHRPQEECRHQATTSLEILSMADTIAPGSRCCPNTAPFFQTAEDVLARLQVVSGEWEKNKDIALARNRLQGEEVEQEDGKWKKERESALQDPGVKIRLKLLSDREADSDEDFVKFIFEYMPPKHVQDWERLKPDLDDKDLDWQKTLQKLITYWCPSSVDKDNVIEYHVICEEIRNKLTKRYNVRVAKIESNEDFRKAFEEFEKSKDARKTAPVKIETNQNAAEFFNMIGANESQKVGEKAKKEVHDIGQRHNEEIQKKGEVKAGVEPVEDSKFIHNVDEFAVNLLHQQRESLKKIAQEKRLNPKRKKKLSKQIDEEKRRLVKVLTDYEELKTLTGKRYKRLRRKVEVDIGELKELIEKVCQQINENTKDYIQTLLDIEQKIRVVSEPEKQEIDEKEARGAQQEFDKDVKEKICQIEIEIDEPAKLKVEDVEKKMKELKKYITRQSQLLELDPQSVMSEVLRLERTLKDRLAREKEREEKEKMMKKKCTRPECVNKGLHRCRRCKTVAYCCQNCLTLHWTNHKTNCDEAVRRKEENERLKEVD